MSKSNIFRRAISVRTWPESKFEWSGTTETYHWLEVIPDGFIGTNRLCESKDEAIEMQNSTGHGERKTGSMAMTATLGYIRMTSNQGTVEVFDPA